MSIFGVPIISPVDDEKQVKDNIYEVTPEIHKALSLTSYPGKSMKNENDQRNLYKFLVKVRYTRDGDRKSNRKRILPDFSSRLKI